VVVSGECMIEPWQCGGEESQPQICHGDVCSYIVVFWNWVDDPATVAHEQVEKYGGTLGFVYKFALKGYSAEYRMSVVNAVACEPTVRYVEMDQVVVIQGASSSGQATSSATVVECPSREPEPEPEPELEPEPESQQQPEPELESAPESDPESESSPVSTNGSVAAIPGDSNPFSLPAEGHATETRSSPACRKGHRLGHRRRMTPGLPSRKKQSRHHSCAHRMAVVEH